MSDNKSKPAILLLAAGVVLALIIVALAFVVFTMQKPAATPAAAPTVAAASASAPAPVAGAAAASASASASAPTAVAAQQPPEAKPAAAPAVPAPNPDQAPGPDRKAAIADEPPQAAKSPGNAKRVQTVDCSNPVRNYERIICSDDELLELDAKLMALYQRSRSRSEDPDYVRDAQRDWERGVRNACENDTCLVKAYKRRIAVVADRLN